MSSYRSKIEARKQEGFYKVADLDGGEISLTIHFLGQDEMHFGRKMDVLHFSDSHKYLQLSTANAEALIDLFCDDPEHWGGQRVALAVDQYKEGKFAIKVKATDEPF
jgi:hypothetical protein